jgi:superfamily II DNA/RNA helicase
MGFCRTNLFKRLESIDDCGQWDPAKDTKLTSLIDLLTKRHRKEKIIVFSQFADTVRYLERRLKSAGIKAMAAVSGDTADPTSFAWRFSPGSNNKRDKIGPDQELRILIATDVLSEGQNLQDGAIIVNYDLPWARAPGLSWRSAPRLDADYRLNPRPANVRRS